MEYLFTKRVLLNIFTALVLISMLTGCIKTIYRGDTKLYVAKKSLILFRVSTFNEVSSEFPLKLAYMDIYYEATKQTQRFDVGREAPDIDPYGVNHYWIGLYLPQGVYQITKIWVHVPGVAPMDSNINIKTYAKFQLEPQKVVYGGTIQVINKVQPQGISNPISDWMKGGLYGAITGINKGVFVITVVDNNEFDIEGFRTRFPILADKEIEKNIVKR